jgi:NAD(P)-dependent dehydrogenase (short-subunit alcohol dehydrogenase family)
MTGSFVQFSSNLETHLATAPLGQLLHHKDINLDGPSKQAYVVAKRGNQLRVQAAARAWGSKVARVTSDSPGVISTALGRKQLEGSGGASAKVMVELSAARRIGVPEDVAGVVVLLTGPEAGFITGNDVLVEGGAVSARKWSSKVEKSKEEQVAETLGGGK